MADVKRDDLFRALAHGDDEHRQWLKEAIDAFYDCKPIPSQASGIPRDPVIEAVRADLLRRQQLGYLKYGGTLATNPADLRGKLQHAYEEALDLCNYLKWSIMQLEASSELVPDPTHNTGLKE